MSKIELDFGRLFLVSYPDTVCIYMKSKDNKLTDSIDIEKHRVINYFISSVYKDNIESYLNIVVDITPCGSSVQSNRKYEFLFSNKNIPDSEMVRINLCLSNLLRSFPRPEKSDNSNEKRCSSLEHFLRYCGHTSGGWKD